MAVKLYTMLVDTYHYILCRLTQCTTLRENTNVTYGLRVIKMHQCNHCTALGVMLITQESMLV